MKKLSEAVDIPPADDDDEPEAEAELDEELVELAEAESADAESEPEEEAEEDAEDESEPEAEADADADAVADRLPLPPSEVASAETAVPAAFARAVETEAGIIQVFAPTLLHNEVASEVARATSLS